MRDKLRFVPMAQVLEDRANPSSVMLEDPVEPYFPPEPPPVESPIDPWNYPEGEIPPFDPEEVLPSIRSSSSSATRWRWRNGRVGGSSRSLRTSHQNLRLWKIANRSVELPRRGNSSIRP